MRSSGAVHRPARVLWSLTAAFLVALLAGCTAPAGAPLVSRAADPQGYRAGSSLPAPYTMPNATLTDTGGHNFNLRRSPSAPVVLLTFGYVNCPDVCRGVMADYAFALQGLDPGVRDRIQMIMVTTDPARDTGPVVRRYLDGFDPSFIGLTGSLSAIKAAGARVGVDIGGMDRLPSGGYEVGHGAQVIGFDAERRGVVVWTPETAAGDLRHDLALLVERSS